MTQNTVTELISLGYLKVSGLDAKKFLQGQLTCDLEDSTPELCLLGAHCNPQGRIISLFHLFQYEGSYLLQMPSSLVPIAYKALKKYAVFFKVELTDVSTEIAALGYCGNEPVFAKKLHAVKLAAPGRYQILGPKEKISSLLKKIIKNETANYSNAWKYIDLRGKLPEIYPETSEKFLPHDINLPALNGVSFKKGCYTGQEIVARMQYRGQLKKSLQFFQTQEQPVRGSEITLEKEIKATVVDYCQVSYNHYELLILTG